MLLPCYSHGAGGGLGFPVLTCMLLPCYSRVKVLAVVWVSLFSHVCYYHATAVPGAGGGFGFPVLTCKLHASSWGSYAPCPTTHIIISVCHESRIMIMSA